MKKVAFISGSTQGIGFGIAQVLSRKGYHVIINGRDRDRLATAQATLGKEHCSILQADLTQDDIASVVKEAANIQGQLDVVVSNIGSGRSENSWNCPESEYRRLFDINFFQATSLITASIPYLSQTKGSAIAIASIAGCESIGAPIAYTAAKAALLAFMKALSQKVASEGVRINAISPGNVLFEDSVWQKKLAENEAAVKQYIKQEVPLNAFASPDDIGEGVAFIAEQSFMTGSNLVIDGGQLKKIG